MYYLVKWIGEMVNPYQRLKIDQKGRCNALYMEFFKTWHPRSGVSKVSPWTQTSLQPVFVDTIFWGHSYAHWYMAAFMLQW